MEPPQKVPKIWPTQEDFPEEEEKIIINMFTLPLGVWQFVKQRVLKTRFGQALVITLKGEDGETQDVAPESLKKKLEGETPKVEYEFILHNGLEQLDDPKNNAYFSFRLIRKPSA